MAACINDHDQVREYPFSRYSILLHLFIILRVKGRFIMTSAAPRTAFVTGAASQGKFLYRHLLHITCVYAVPINYF